MPFGVCPSRILIHSCCITLAVASSNSRAHSYYLCKPIYGERSDLFKLHAVAIQPSCKIDSRLCKHLWNHLTWIQPYLRRRSRLSLSPRKSTIQKHLLQLLNQCLPLYSQLSLKPQLLPFHWQGVGSLTICLLTRVSVPVSMFLWRIPCWPYARSVGGWPNKQNIKAIRELNFYTDATADVPAIVGFTVKYDLKSGTHGAITHGRNPDAKVQPSVLKLKRMSV